MSNDICQLYYVDQERVARARARMRDDRTIVDLAETFKVLGEPTRVRILHAIAEEELCVCDIAAVVVATQSAISHQLRILRSARLVRSRKEGKMVYYSLDDDHVRHLFEEGIRHLEEG
ncbi:ArsR/SmtB family transcription factor [Geopsychrobacter electrodiphilus]|uniref:ArsR/SmtB family transcription factor n=1 Tax=Geopsychrobacter electrodiphilus TaxID=225196 RepID=UPI0003A50CB7|nr:metalloregulator ArsR/SmtB family transcription factor [Geopsychrobacter electrodiphilus]